MGEPGANEGYDAVSELCLRHVAFACTVAPFVKSKASQKVWQGAASPRGCKHAGSEQHDIVACKVQG
jgi:hypothetical protein